MYWGEEKRMNRGRSRVKESKRIQPFQGKPWHHQEMDPTCEDCQPKEPGARLTGSSRNRNRGKRNRGAWR